MKTRYVMTAASLLTGLAPLQSFSQERSDWTFNLAPFYLWAISIDGDLGIREKSASTSIDFGDVWDNLNGVFTIRFDTFYRERFGLIVDYNYLDLGTEKVNEGVNAEAGFTSQILNFFRNIVITKSVRTDKDFSDYTDNRFPYLLIDGDFLKSILDLVQNVHQIAVRTGKLRLNHFQTFLVRSVRLTSGDLIGACFPE